jgi:D-alanyl-D-alanine carboxypeptidase
LTPQTASEPFSVDGTIIVNKKHPLPADYDPGENAEAAENLRELIVAAQNSGDYYASRVGNSWSGFRSFPRQDDLFNSYESHAGPGDDPKTYSAEAGYSEHQTGLAFDLLVGVNLYRNGDPEYDYATDWIAQHAAEYGFIVRYRKEWEEITGYIAEPWHLRYIGKDLAQKVHAQDVPLETYFNVSGGDYWQD